MNLTFGRYKMKLNRAAKEARITIGTKFISTVYLIQGECAFSNMENLSLQAAAYFRTVFIKKFS